MTTLQHSWRTSSSNSYSCKEFELLGEVFSFDKNMFPKPELIETVYDENDSDIRYEYYGIPNTLEGTMYTSLEKGSLSGESKFYAGETIENVVDRVSSGNYVFTFWCIWVVVTAVIGFLVLLVTDFYAERFIKFPRKKRK